MDKYKKYGWGNIYYRYLRNGHDNGYAAYMADRYCDRKEKETSKK